ncbi:MAG: zinc ribbon domain-containing protein [Candidatus Methanoculleus thermohydrogenotrophicum]|nr:zinc ribbon domain-containing protein [Candidatus Methanoculleus thermohydrogenotrophicum]
MMPVQTICVEDLNIKGLKEEGNNKGLHRGIHDASRGRFYSYLAYRAESAGTEPVKLDPRNTSQMYSNCGSIVKKVSPGKSMNARVVGFLLTGIMMRAVNILRVGMEQPFEPLERRPLHQYLCDASVVHDSREAPPPSGRGSSPRTARGVISCQRGRRRQN